MQASLYYKLLHGQVAKKAAIKQAEIVDKAKSEDNDVAIIQDWSRHPWTAELLTKLDALIVEKFDALGSKSPEGSLTEVVVLRKVRNLMMRGIYE